jgi:hypothetical protein
VQSFTTLGVSVLALLIAIVLAIVAVILGGGIF